MAPLDLRPYFGPLTISLKPVWPKTGSGAQHPRFRGRLFEVFWPRFNFSRTSPQRACRARGVDQAGAMSRLDPCDALLPFWSA